ncbi:uncharacterized protein J3R85_017906 [Psidium guajava]|nr:uncharacterized protein J3R85_017906 [Psidium guajava]
MGRGQNPKAMRLGHDPALVVLDSRPCVSSVGIEISSSNR